MSMQNPKVSIIIPIHNASTVLNRCLDTLLKQTLRDIEIICILDCPTDGSDNIVHAYAQQDSRIVVHENKENLHIAECRNIGIALAKGEYIGFSDHDDYRELNMYEILYKEAKQKDADVVVSASYTERDGVVEKKEYKDVSQQGIINSLILPMHDSNNPNYLARSVWASIYKTTVVRNNNIHFYDRRLFLEEDTLFNLSFYTQANVITYVPQAFYHWCVSEHTTSNAPRVIQPDTIVNYLCQVASLIDISLYQDAFETLLAYHIYKSCTTLPYSSKLNSLSFLLKQINYSIFSKKYPDSLRCMGRKRTSIVWLVFKLKYLA